MNIQFYNKNGVKILQRDLDVHVADTFLCSYTQKESMIEVEGCISTRQLRNDVIGAKNIKEEGIIHKYIRENNLGLKNYDYMNLPKDVTMIKSELRNRRVNDQINYVRSFNNKIWSAGAGNAITRFFTFELYKLGAIKHKHSYIAIDKFYDVIEMESKIASSNNHGRKHDKQKIMDKYANKEISIQEGLWELQSYWDERESNFIVVADEKFRKIFDNFRAELRLSKDYEHYLLVKDDIETLLSSSPDEGLFLFPKNKEEGED